MSKVTTLVFCCFCLSISAFAGDIIDGITIISQTSEEIVVDIGDKKPREIQVAGSCGEGEESQPMYAVKIFPNDNIGEKRQDLGSSIAQGKVTTISLNGSGYVVINGVKVQPHKLFGGQELPELVKVTEEVSSKGKKSMTIILPTIIGAPLIK